MEAKYIISEKIGNVGVITLNRPQVLNAVNAQMISEIAQQVGLFETDPEIGAMVITGNEKAFAAGIDLMELKQKSEQNSFMLSDYHKAFENIAACSKPLIAAVAGYALGIGCELALYCDIILAADNARFGQPEISLGMIPGFGGTQKLTQAVGKAKAMEMILTARAMTAEEADLTGLVSRVVPLADLEEESLRTAAKIAALPRIAVEMAKDAINRPLVKTTEKGIDIENGNCQACLNSEDFKESLQAFTEKRAPNYKNR